MLFWAVGSVPTWDVGGTKKEPILTGMQIFMLLELRKNTHIEAVKGEMADGLLRKFQKTFQKLHKFSADEQFCCLAMQLIVAFLGLTAAFVCFLWGFLIFWQAPTPRFLEERHGNAIKKLSRG